MLDEAYKLGSIQSQVLRSAMELDLQPRSIWCDFEQSRERKRLGQNGDELSKACFEKQHLEKEQKDMDILRESISRASNVSK